MKWRGFGRKLFCFDRDIIAKFALGVIRMATKILTWQKVPGTRFEQTNCQIQIHAYSCRHSDTLGTSIATKYTEMYLF
jgi:hypothetical protein